VRSCRPSLPLVAAIAALALLAVGRSAEIRERAEAGLGRGMPDREAALARGFVLGEDEEIDVATKEDFRRSGLSHLLAVSGQNVTLLALLAMPVLAALGIALRERLLWVLALIAAYVPLAGSGPTIQRAAVMGAAGLVATLAGRRASRAYALLLALGVTLAVDPGVAGDIGWQLSFAAVAGIFLLAAPLCSALSARLGRGPLRGALAEGLAVTAAATLATAPLIAFHFETLSTTTLLANLLAMPAVAPAMWLGMLSAAFAQVPGLPLGPVNAANAVPLAYVAQVAAWCGRPGWAEVRLQLGAGGLLATYAGLGAAVWAAMRWARRRRLARARSHRRPGPGAAPAAHRFLVAMTARRRLALAAAAVLLVMLVLWQARSAKPAAGPASAPGLRIEVLDVGQGDAILLAPARAPALLVDAGPPGAGLLAKLRDAGVDRLAAVVLSHDQSDHSGGVAELLGHMSIGRLLYARLGRTLRAAAAGAVVEPARIAAGGSIRSGALRLDVLWPPPALLAAPLGSADPNQQALVLLAHWHGFSMLLTGDAEAEAVPIDPGPVDVLKVAHHGSEDAGLPALLDRLRPRLAVISVGEGNPFGHPTAATLRNLTAARVPVLRTDRDGAIEIDVWRRSFRVTARD
jgi:competence protein ComEC